MAGEGRVLNISIKLTAPGIEVDPETVPDLVGYKVRLVSEWLDCCGPTAIFGKGELAWSEPPPEEEATESKGEEGEGEEPEAVAEKKPFRKDATCLAQFPLPQYLIPRDEITEEIDEDDRKAKISHFNLKPGIYFILCKDTKRQEVVEGEEEPKSITETTPLAFSYLDCSSFLMNPGVIKANHLKIDGYDLEVTISLEDRMLTYSEIVESEPLVLDFKK